MSRYLVKRISSGLISFVIFTAILFFSFNILIPFDFVTTLALRLPGTEAREALREELGLNLPLWQQYFNWLRELAQGDWGRQFTLFGRGDPVPDLLGKAIPSTLLVFITGAFIAFLLGQWLGKITAWRAPKWFSGAITFGSIAAYTAFPPWLAFLLGYLLIERFQLLPTRMSRRDLTRMLWFDAPYSSPAVMMYMVYSLLAMLVAWIILNRLARRLWRRNIPVFLAPIFVVAGVYIIGVVGGFVPYALDIAQSALIPFLAFILLGFGDTMLIMQASMVDTRHEMYIQTARAKGLPERMVRNKHAARNALLPVLTRFVINLPYLLTAIVIIERATGWPGVGDLLFSAIYDQNTFVYMDVLVIVGLISLVARLLLDVAYVYLDPRIRYDEYMAGGGA